MVKRMKKAWVGPEWQRMMDQLKTNLGDKAPSNRHVSDEAAKFLMRGKNSFVERYIKRKKRLGGFF